MPRRFGRPGLVGTMARTAVIAGTANATANAMNRRQAGRQQAAANEQAAQQAAFESQAQLAEMQAQLNAVQAQQAPPPAPAAAAGPATRDSKASEGSYLFTISTRRLSARPASESLDPTGGSGPTPRDVRRPAEMP